MNIYSLFKNVAFQVDPEKMHELSIAMLSRFPHFSCNAFGGGLEIDKKMQLQVGSLKWSFPVGLAAGLDKNAQAIDFFSSIGFGAVEVGTVTPLPQQGNPRPRLFRYPKEESLRNCMGFNNQGADAVYENIVSSNKNGRLLGVNLGKNKVTPQEEASEDYKKLYDKLAPVADYVVINVSSPNTPGLRDLQQKEGMETILKSLEAGRQQCSKPLYIKVSPDTAYEDLEAIIDLAAQYELEGLIATNTTIMPEKGVGGVSGGLLKEKAREVRNFILSKKSKDLELIGVGGVDCIDDLIDFWRHGGKVMQLYSSFIYQGPEILYKLDRDIHALLIQHRVHTLGDLVALYCHC